MLRAEDLYREKGWNGPPPPPPPRRGRSFCFCLAVAPLFSYSLAPPPSRGYLKVCSAKAGRGSEWPSPRRRARPKRALLAALSPKRAELFSFGNVSNSRLFWILSLKLKRKPIRLDTPRCSNLRQGVIDKENCPG